MSITSRTDPATGVMSTAREKGNLRQPPSRLPQLFAKLGVGDRAADHQPEFLERGARYPDITSSAPVPSRPQGSA